MKTLLATTALAASLIVGAGAASAAPFSDTFAISVYHGTGLTGGETGAGVQALPSAIPLLSSVGSFSYTGGLNFFSNTNDSLGFFIASGGGAVTGTVPNVPSLSTSGFTDATLLKLTFTVPTAETGTISFDDGISLYAAGSTTTNLFPGHSAPTDAVPTPFTVAAGAYDLYYTETNGLPAELSFNVTSPVPEPASMALLGAGLLGAGLVRRKTRVA